MHAIRLWVDDLRDPSARNEKGELIFLESWEDPDNWVWAKTITEAIRLLSTQVVSHVSLDHDITHAILPGDAERVGLIYAPVCCPENYTAVARYIAAMTVDERPEQVDIHTANPAGAKEMGMILSGLVKTIRRRNL